jgi:hypothetical protein
MKTLAAVKLLSIVACCAIWSGVATAQNSPGTKVQAGTGTARHKLARNTPQSAGQFHSVCITDRGITCAVSRSAPVLPDSICHCGSLVGSTLSGSQ